MQHTYIALDLETTGLSATKDRILEIGAVMVENGEVTGTYETFVDNGVEIPERIRELTGITEDMVAGSPEMKPAVEGFLAFSGEKPLLGHNILFDYGFMKRQPPERHQWDMLRSQQGRNNSLILVHILF